MADCPLTLTGTCCPDVEVTVVTGPLVETAEYIMPQTIEVQSVLSQTIEIEYVYSTFDFDYIYQAINDIGLVPILYTSDEPLYINLIDGMTVGDDDSLDFIDGGVVGPINFCQVWDGGYIGSP